jgi:prepilin-type N-terminal cleavage/methylation domain-containing protein
VARRLLLTGCLHEGVSMGLAATMGLTATRDPKRNSKTAMIVAMPGARVTRGFSIVELVIAVAIALILSAIAIPSMKRTLRGYQTNDAANQVAGIVKFTRFEAIRRNSPVTCVNAQNVANGPTTIWSDDNGDNVAQSTEKQILLSRSTNLQPAGAVPSTGALAAAVGAGALTAINPTNGNITFDQRGAVVPPGLYVFYVGNSTPPDVAYRAVIILPSGSIQVWTYNGGGTWVQLS